MVTYGVDETFDLNILSQLSTNFRVMQLQLRKSDGFLKRIIILKA